MQTETVGAEVVVPTLKSVAIGKLACEAFDFWSSASAMRSCMRLDLTNGVKVLADQIQRQPFTSLEIRARLDQLLSRLDDAPCMDEPANDIT